jgi:hypothetical protein
MSFSLFVSNQTILHLLPMLRLNSLINYSDFQRANFCLRLDHLAINIPLILNQASTEWFPVLFVEERSIELLLPIVEPYQESVHIAPSPSIKTLENTDILHFSTLRRMNRQSISESLVYSSLSLHCTRRPYISSHGCEALVLKIIKGWWTGRILDI